MSSNRFWIIVAVILAGSAYFYFDRSGEMGQQASDTSGASDVSESDTSGDAMPTGRLSSAVVPTHYKLDLEIDPRNARFSGQVEITVDLKLPTDTIWLHGADINVSEAVLSTAGGAIAASYAQVDDTGIARISLRSSAPAGEARLRMTYDAPFNGALEGLYKVKDGGEDYAFTQFEATSARFAYPSFDDPQFKTPYDVSVTVDNDHEVITNTPIKSETPLDGKRRVEFATSKPMPTYLVAFAVGPMDIVEWEAIPTSDLRDRVIPLRGVAAKGKGDKLAFALENTAHIVNTLEEYFGVPYPYAKLDILAVPDFAAGAMENVGAITYREQLLLLDEDSPLNQKRAYFGVHAHELAHMWFGNLVTPVWWDDIWLNESFATWMAAKANDIAYPEQNFGGVMHDRALGVMSQDAQVSARQVRQPITSNHDIATAFDGITYAKGGAVLRMFESYMGEDGFREGIRVHMRRFPFGNADVYDFLDSLEQGSGDSTIRSAFSTFILQPGVPLLDLSGFSSDDGGTSLTLSQSRYLRMGSEGSTEQTWELPVCLRFGTAMGEEKRCFIMKDGTQSYTFDDVKSATYVFPNAGGTGYYRWAMDEAGWVGLLANYDALTGAEKKSLYDGAYSSFRAGGNTVEQLMAVMELVAKDQIWDVSNKPMRGLGTLAEYYVPEEVKEAFLAASRAAYADQLATLGLHADTSADAVDSVSTALKRNAVVDFMATVGESPELREELAALAQSYLSADGEINPEAINSDLVDTALEVAAGDLDAGFTDRMFAQLETSRDARLRQYLIYALLSAEDKAVTERLQGLILSDTIRDNEASAIFFGLSGNKVARDDLWQWMQQNMDALLNRLPTWHQGRLPRIAQPWCDVSRIDELKAVFDPIIGGMEGGPRHLAQTIEVIKLCDALKNGRRDEFLLYFGGKPGSS